MKSSFRIEPAPIQAKDAIFSLLQQYLTELSLFPDENIDYKDVNGVYLYPYLDNYWQEKERYPYILYSDGTPAGFALVRLDGDHWEMAEFYVKPEFRRRGLAESCVKQIFQKHPGLWRIGFNKHNQASSNLWYKLAESLASGNIKKGNMDNSHEYILFEV